MRISFSDLKPKFRGSTFLLVKGFDYNGFGWRVEKLIIPNTGLKPMILSVRWSSSYVENLTIPITGLK